MELVYSRHRVYVKMLWFYGPRNDLHKNCVREIFDVFEVVRANFTRPALRPKLIEPLKRSPPKRSTHCSFGVQRDAPVEICCV